MDIKEEFIHALVSAPKLFPGSLPENFLGQVYHTESNPDSLFWEILAGGNITAASPWSFDIRSLDCFMLLYTKSGCGKLLLDGQVYTLTESSLLFLDCHQRFRLDLAIEPWDYHVLFVTGKGLSDYYHLIPSAQIAIMPLSRYSESAFHLDKLLISGQNDSLSSKLTVSSLLNAVITNCVVYQLSKNESLSPVAPYLNEVKDLFDNNFQEDYSLDDLAERFHISKYKLCREFKAAFDLPPLQYLNRKRIEFAKHLLLTTSLKVHEVGSSVGIDNTNHFIFLFKKFTGFTPLEFRQRGHEL
ncbi:MAG: helix-turn-helix transcriptional regulator [Suilimivivens sp.]